MRARISLGDGIPHENAPSRLWYPIPSSPLQISVFLSQLLAALHDPPLPAEHVTVSLDGFNILHSSTTELLRDGDLLQVDIGNGGAFAAAQPKKRKQSANPAQAAQQPRAKIIKGDSNRKLDPLAHKSEITPAASPEQPPLSSEKRPSRSARRKAAKRKWRRLGFPSLPFMKKKPSQKEKILDAAIPPGNPAEANKATKSLEENNTSSSSEGSSSSESEETTTGSASNTSSDSSDTSSDSTSEEDSDNKDVPTNSKESAFKIVSEEEFARLPQCVGAPDIGQVLAYKLLEIGDTFAPQVSEIRMGRVAAVDPTVPATTVTLEPYPDPSKHPLAQQMIEREAQVEESDEEMEFAPPSSYDEQGMLTTDLSSFVDVRCYIDLLEQNGAQAGIQDQVLVNHRAKEVEHLGPSNYSKLGPPRPANLDATSRNPMSWAWLAKSLEKRRTELSAASPAALSKDSSQMKKKDVDVIAPAIPAPAPAPAPQSNGKPSAAASGRGRRRGSLQSALGPMLRMLRSSQQLE